MQSCSTTNGSGGHDDKAYDVMTMTLFIDTNHTNYKSILVFGILAWPRFTGTSNHVTELSKALHLPGLQPSVCP